MACRSCQLEIAATLCQVCRYLTEETPQAPREQPATCKQCGAPIARRAEGVNLCQLCTTLLQIVRNSGWFVRAQAEWEEENVLLAQRKRELLGQEGLFAS